VLRGVCVSDVEWEGGIYREGLSDAEGGIESWGA